MAGERIRGAERDPEATLVLATVRGDAERDRGREAHPVALEVAVVDPDRIEALVARRERPGDDLLDVAAGGESKTDPARQGAHGVRLLREVRLRRARQRTNRCRVGASAPTTRTIE